MELERVDQIIDRHQSEASALIQVLLDIQQYLDQCTGFALMSVNNLINPLKFHIRFPKCLRS